MFKKFPVPGLLGLAFLVVGFPGAGVATSPEPFADFKAKRVKPPAEGTKKRITIQIDPTQIPKPKPKRKPPVLTEDVEAGDGATPAVPGRFGWFWERVSPELAQAGPGRLSQALRALSGDSSVATPRLQAMQDIARSQGAPILQSTVGTEVSPALVLAVIAIESAGKPDAVSHAGAQGLMQLMPATAARFGVQNSLEAAENIRGGVRYLDWLMKEFDNDPIMVLAGYNAGEGAVRRHKGVPPYAETRDYVPKVLAAFQVASGLCRTPPELITDGCVFTAMN